MPLSFLVITCFKYAIYTKTECILLVRHLQPLLGEISRRKPLGGYIYSEFNGAYESVTQAGTGLLATWRIEQNTVSLRGS